MDQGADFERERKRLTVWAWRVTVGYCLLLLFLALLALLGDKGLDTFLKMGPNEVGDLLAGIAGPLALMWLIYGYFLQGIAIRQQAQEVSQNTQALKLQEEALRAQVEELRRSVEQQSHLVSVSREQTEAGMRALQFEMRRDSQSAKPVFVLEVARVSFYSSVSAVLSSAPGEKRSLQYLIEVDLRNYGNVVTEISLLAENFEAAIFPNKISSMDFKDALRITFVVEPQGACSFYINIGYRDKNDERGEQRFELTTIFSSDGKLQWLNSSRLD